MLCLSCVFKNCDISLSQSNTFFGHLQCVKLLLEKGADRSIKGADDQTAFEAADSEAIKALFK
uniref:Myotrophin n=1 Tax=Oryzias sinensis TaxID=183150 RepID=A0A8C7YJ43_9TELE